jgi:N-succinyl-L-ornithine transcarbamylase
MKQFISTADVTSIPDLIQSALAFKANPQQQKELGKNKTIGLLFLNPSLRTRISTQVAAKNLGMEVIVFNVDKDGWQLEFGEGVIMNGNTTEHVKEAAAGLGQYVNILGVRSFPTLTDREKDYSEYVINAFIKYSGVPVVSLESATLHPLQSLADLVTIQEIWHSSPLPRRGAGGEAKKPKVVLTWAPHVKALPQAVPNSFAQWVNAWGQADFVIAHPEGYHLDEKFTKGATITHNQDEALKEADFVYVKNWSSYQDYGKILNSDPTWTITNSKIAQTNAGKVMHCLPVRRNLVIADEVLDGPSSIVVQQAGNRVWAAQAVLSEILKSH